MVSVVSFVVVIALALWLMMPWIDGRSTDIAARAECERAYARAETRADSLRVDRMIPRTGKAQAVAPVNCRGFQRAVSGNRR